MKQLTYDELVEEIIALPSIVSLLPEGCVMSPLYIGQEDGRPCHVFLRLEQTEENVFTADAKITLTAPDQPPQVTRLEEIPLDLTPASEEAWPQYTMLYPQVFRQAFAADCESRQQARALLLAWSCSVSPSVKNAFERIAPELSQWADQKQA